jgi:hypothetical protein
MFLTSESVVHSPQDGTSCAEHRIPAVGAQNRVEEQGAATPSAHRLQARQVCLRVYCPQPLNVRRVGWMNHEAFSSQVLQNGA